MVDPRLFDALHDGRLENYAGIGAKRLSGIRDSLAQRLRRVHKEVATTEPVNEPAVSELLDVDREYRQKAMAGALKKIAPRRFNPMHEAWLPILHTSRDERHYIALFSNTARAHELGKTRDWVVLFCDGGIRENRYTVITSQFGPLSGRRIVPGREADSRRYSAAPAAMRCSRSACSLPSITSCSAMVTSLSIGLSCTRQPTSSGHSFQTVIPTVLDETSGARISPSIFSAASKISSFRALASWIRFGIWIVGFMRFVF